MFNVGLENAGPGLFLAVGRFEFLGFGDEHSSGRSGTLDEAGLPPTAPNKLSASVHVCFSLVFVTDMLLVVCTGTLLSFGQVRSVCVDIVHVDLQAAA